MRFDIRKFEQTTSTNDDARVAGEAGAPAGTVIWAVRQSAGRGRRGRQWESPEGNLYGSVVLRPAGGRSVYGLYAFVAALAIFETVAGLLPEAKIELKWPNDVLAGGKKISGVLLESGGDFLIMGIGINVRHCPENPLYPVTSLAAEMPAAPPVEDVLNRLLGHIGYWDDILTREGFAPLRQRWLAHARKGAMRVRLPNEEIAGEFADLDENGHLHLLLPDKTTRVITAGDVFF
ncbi:MAG: biotin--[acetyl-CoA-carboxylase] ligase [Alphaproteobacteria bacterium]|nr:biotin--[acetyl-CoA-carboxylase] ligase [Alphaproteobacteria bacterium]